MVQAIQQTIIPENVLLDKFRSLTLEQQRTLIDFLEFMSNKNSVPENTQTTSAYDELSEFIGCVDGGPGDLATNKKYLEGLGQ
jgi:hypothetical protein